MVPSKATQDIAANAVEAAEDFAGPFRRKITLHI